MSESKRIKIICKKIQNLLGNAALLIPSKTRYPEVLQCSIEFDIYINMYVDFDDIESVVKEKILEELKLLKQKLETENESTS